LPAHRVAVKTAVRNHEQQRLAPELEAALQDLEDLPVRHLVYLVRQDEIRSRPRARLARVARHRTEKAAGRVMRDIVFPPEATGERQALRQRRRLPDHLHGVGEQDRGLLLLRGGRIDLRARLSVRRQSLQPDPAGQGALPVALALFDIGPPEPPPPIRALPAEQRPDDEGLARMEDEGLPLELPLRQLQNRLEEIESLL